MIEIILVISILTLTIGGMIWFFIAAMNKVSRDMEEGYKKAVKRERWLFDNRKKIAEMDFLEWQSFWRGNE